MADISKVKLPDNVTYNLKDGSAVANITRNGATFTVTKRDGTTFTFTQQDNNTTYTLGTSGNNITLTPSSGSVQSITAPYATSAGSATKATQDGSGNTITSTYVKKSGDTMTGELKLYREGTTTQNVGAYLTFQNKDTTTGKTSNGYIIGYNGGENGLNMVLTPGGNMFIGSGEAAQNHYNLYTHNTGENFFATADTDMLLQSNGQTIANRVGVGICADHTIRPIKADVSTNNVGSIGTSSYRWAGMYAMKYNGLLTGTGTAGKDKGSGTTNRYVPAKWTFNIGSNTVGEGDLFVIKLPVAGHDYGTYLSLNNGTNYYPVIYNTSVRLANHFPASSCIIVTFDSAGSAGSIFPLNGGDARTTVSGGAFRVVDFYDSGNSIVGQTATTTNANYEVLFSGTADNTTRTEGSRKNSNFTFNPSTGALYVDGFMKIDLTDKTVDLNDLTLSSGAPHIMRYIERTNGGANNISNRPITETRPFILDVELIRWSSTSDYQTRQTYRDYSNSTKEYVRFCANGSWSAWTTRVFTDNNTTYTLGTSGDNITLTPSSGSVQSITAPYASSTKKLANYYDSRPTDCNLLLGDGSLRTFQATSVMTSNKPPIGDAHIIHLAWDGTNGYDGQIALKNSGAAMMCRAQSSKTWGSWMPIGVFTQATPTTGQVVITDGTVGGIKSSGYTIAKSVPSNAVFTDSSGNNRVLRAGDNMTGSLTTTGSFIADTQVGAPTIAASSNLYAGDFCKITSSGTTGTNGSAYIRAINDESGTTHTLIKIGNGSISCENSAGTPVSLTASAIELSHATPLIDFHHNSSTQDFTSRIITTNLAELTFYGKNSGGTTVYGTCRGAAFTVVSSKYMKENIKDIEDDEAKKLLQLRPVSFDYKYTGETNKRGLIAEEVLDVMPEMVYVPEDYSEPMDDTIPDNVPSIDYSKFVPYLIKMVQIQQKEIDELKARI